MPDRRGGRGQSKLAGYASSPPISDRAQTCAHTQRSFFSSHVCVCVSMLRSDPEENTQHLPSSPPNGRTDLHLAPATDQAERALLLTASTSELGLCRESFPAYTYAFFFSSSSFFWQCPENCRSRGGKEVRSDLSRNFARPRRRRRGNRSAAHTIHGKNF